MVVDCSYSVSLNVTQPPLTELLVFQFCLEGIGVFRASPSHGTELTSLQ